MNRRFFAEYSRHGLVAVMCVFAVVSLASAAVQNRFDRLKEADRIRFSKRFAKEIWPFLLRRGKDGCVGCHKPNHRSNLRLTGDPDADFRFMLREGFLLANDAGSVLNMVRSTSRLERMPPGNRPRWTKKEIAVLRRFVIDLDKHQQNPTPAQAGAEIRPPHRRGPKSEIVDSKRAMIGKKAPNLKFKTTDGKLHSLYDLKDKKAIVVVFLSFDCPVSNSYSKPLADIHNEFREYGVSLIGLTTNEDQTPAEVARSAKEYKIPFPVAIDCDLKFADALKANITPEVFVLDGNYVLRYRGRIDNAFYARLKRNHQVSCHDLHQALGELMSGRPISNAATVAVGCPIQRELNTAKDGPVTYYRDVLPILQKNCQQCHRPGEVGQFSLMKYRQAVNWGEDIKYFTGTRFMPPWKPSGGDFRFHNERTLTKKEIDTLAKWVECKMPLGKSTDAPRARKFATGWQLGKPDLVLEVPSEFQIGADGGDVFRCFALPTNLTKDKHVRAVEIRPGNPRVVHHTLLFVDTTGQARRLESLEKEGKNKLNPHHSIPGSDDKGPGYSVAMGVGFAPSGGLGGWAPGVRARYLPGNYSYFLPKKSDIVLQVHYHRNGRLEKDRTRIGIYFAKKPNPPLYQSGVLAGSDGGGLFFKIPAGNAAYKLTGNIWAWQDCKLFSVMPHMHLLGKSIKVSMTPPGGKKSTLLDIKDWNYNWQEVYFVKTPIPVRKGTRFDVEAIYDNSDKNPHNPNAPPKDVTYGEQTTDEMCFVFFGGASSRAGRRLPLSFTAPIEARKRKN